MAFNVFLICKLIHTGLALVIHRLLHRIHAKIHRYTYKAVTNAKNVIVIGGSFAGYAAAKQLSETLPTGFRVILIEKHTHFQFTWNFPRVSVVEGHTKNAFIPYPPQSSVKPEGVYQFRQGEVLKIEGHLIVLSDKSTIPFEYLIVATGSQARYPSRLDANDKIGGVKFFEEQQERIRNGTKILIVGAGAAGVEVAGDIKSIYPEKKVMLVHSRQQILNNFGPQLHTAAKNALEELGVELHLGERVVAVLNGPESTQVRLLDGKVLHCDTLIQCIGQTPDSSLVRDAFPSAVSPSGFVLVEKTLRIKNAPLTIFACGDVVDLPGPKLGRAAIFQGFLAAENIVRLISGQAMKSYKSGVIDRSIELTLGLGTNVTYVNDAEGSEMTMPKKVPDVDMHAAQAWKHLGATPFRDPDEV